MADSDSQAEPNAYTIAMADSDSQAEPNAYTIAMADSDSKAESNSYTIAMADSDSNAYYANRDQSQAWRFRWRPQGRSGRVQKLERIVGDSCKLKWRGAGVAFE
jgi:hypothetical protein